MKKVLLILLAGILLQSAYGQKYMTRNGYIGFFSHTSIEDIKADNNQVASVLDAATGELVFQVLMKSFKFERSLMEEHFNENYVESDLYPKATFSGKISDGTMPDFKKQGKYDVTVEGEMTIHGVSRKVSATGMITVNGEGIEAVSKFLVNPEDYKIAIPGVVRQKIANELEITVSMNYTAI